MERVGGHLILADYDELELSNLNRLRTGIPQIGLHKGVIAKRQIAELDPYIKVTLFDEGVTDKNIASFLNKDVDILVEVCDSLDLKLSLRERAKVIEIPVIMDTNDRGMIDIERFDLEPDRPIFHGFLEDLNMTNEELKKPENKLSLVQRIVGEDISERLKKSMPEIGKSISSWPQLASGVMLGGAASTNICRRILLNEHKKSGRFYVDFEQIIGS
jgi:molybdopterin/thiamine biosynthesis adenylyltransferase